MAEFDSTKDFDEWAHYGLGALLQTQEFEILEDALPHLFGYYLLQIGGWIKRCAGASPIRYQYRLSMMANLSPGSQPIVSKWDHLPIKSDSVDVVLLTHTLEMAQFPHEVLREVERVLLPEGHVVITGFNPFSFWLLKRWPWKMKYIRRSRLEDWLNLLGMEVISHKRFFYRPPINHPRLMSLLSFMESIGRLICPFIGGAYLIVARKRVSTITPQPLRWKLRRQLETTGEVEPEV